MLLSFDHWLWPETVPKVSVCPLFPVLVSWVMGSHGPEVMAHAWPPALAKEGDRVQGPVTEGKVPAGVYYCSD